MSDPTPAFPLPGIAYRCRPDAARTLLAVTGKVAELTGIPPGQWIDSGLTACIHPEDRDAVWRNLYDGLRHDGCFDLEYRLVMADGRCRPVQEHGEGVPDGEGGWRELIGFISDSSARLAHRERQRQAQAAIVRAAEHPLQGGGDIEAYARVLTRLVCDTLQVRHAGIWMLAPDGSGLTQLSVHDRETGLDTQGLTLAARDYPDYFAALLTGRAIDAEDARLDPRTREFREGYLEPLGIHAMLDAAIRVNGRIVGIVCCEHAGRPRRWHTDEISFAGEIADQMAHALISRDKLEALRQLRQERGSIRARTDFLARLSHEIRTPMNGVLGMAELLRQTRVTKEQREYLEVIEQSGRLLLHLVNDILDYAKIEAGKLTVRPRPSEARPLLEGVCRQFRERAAAAGLQLKLQVEDSLPATVVCDAERVQQIVVNLVGNAVKFTPSGQVRVQAWATEGDAPRWHIRVSDTGIGLSPELLARLFEPFEQGEAPAGVKGTGLGLAISRNLALLMGGTLEATGEPGQGASFTLSLPLLPDSGAVEVREEAPLPAVARPSLRVLVVEDNEINRMVLCGMLTRYFDIQAETSANGQEALARLAAGERYDLVFMDCEMPVMDGFETTRRIRCLPGEAAQVPIAAISAHAVEDVKARAYTAGVDYYVTKPFGQESLSWVIRQVRASGAPEAD